jgi:probable HAF family extracellular repeat protein
MAANHSATRLAVVVTCVAFAPSPLCADCYIVRVIAHPTRSLTPVDAVSLEVFVRTGTSTPYLYKPSEARVEGNRITIDVFVESGPLFFPSFIVESVPLGKLDEGTYEYVVTQHGNGGFCSETSTFSGTICVDDPQCTGGPCTCPRFCPSYLITHLTTPAYKGRVANAINNQGQVVGGGYGTAYTAFLWQGGEMLDLGTLRPEDHESAAYDINNLRQVVGYSYSGLSSAFLWSDGEMTALDGFPGTEEVTTVPHALNDSGQIVGRASIDEHTAHAVLWQDDEIVDLTNEYGVRSATDINNVGQILGPGSILQPDGTLTEVLRPDGLPVSPRALNDAGQVTARASEPAPSTVYSAFLWSDGEFTDIGAIGGFSRSEGVAINNPGQIVGVALPETRPALAFLYDRQHGFRFLRDLVRTDADWWGLSPNDINEAGQIVGQGEIGFDSGIGRDDAFLMTPIAEEGCLCLRNFAGFQNCFAPAADIPDGCHRFDYRPDGRPDGRVDLGDHQDFADTFTAHLGP